MTTDRSRIVRRAAAGTAGLVAVAALLAGCSGSGEPSSGSAATTAPDAARAPDAYTTEGGAAGAASDGKVPDAGSLTTVTVDRSVIVRADMTVRVESLAPAVDRLGALVVKYGATVASQTTSSGDGVPEPVPMDSNGKQACPSTGCGTDYASSTTTLRVDNSRVDALLKDLAALGTVETAYRTSEDVTAQVADVDARVANARASLARVRALMSRAVTIADVVTLEGELSRREADLESLEAQQRALADQTAQATVTVRLVDQGAPVVQEEESGFLAGLKAGWNAFTAAAVAALTVVGAVLPFLLVLVPLGLLVWWLVRRTPRRHGHDSTAETPPTV